MMTIWNPDITGHHRSKSLAIAEAIARDIENGTLVDGDRLPPQRDLAYGLGVSLNTVTRGYAEAARRGLVGGETGRGTYIRVGTPAPLSLVPARTELDSTGPIDLTLNLPVPGNSADLLRDTLVDLAGSNILNDLLDYQPGGGLPAHKAAGAAWIGRSGLHVSDDNVFVTAGAQHAILVALMATTRPGDTVLVETMTYPSLKQIASHLGLKLIPVALDEAGLIPSDLDTACAGTGAKVLYCLPTIQTPTTVTMPEDRRREIADVARRHGLTIIEDDVFGMLPEERPLPLAAFAPERSLYITGVSKSLAPGLRIGYLSAPAAYKTAIASAITSTCWVLPPLMAEIATRWIADGTADRLNGLQRREIAARLDMAREYLGAYELHSHPNSLHVWLPLPPPLRAEEFRVNLAGHGVKVLTAEVFAVGQTSAPQAIRICLGYETSRERLLLGLQAIAGNLKDPNPPDEMYV